MSAILSADDLNDFISPGVACIKPVETLPHQEPQHNPYEVTTEEKVQAANPPPASISLTDCLACSGCVTSAEAVLISLQSHTEVLTTLDAHNSLDVRELLSGSINSPVSDSSDAKLFIASVSPQVRASLAATFGISERRAGYMIEQLLSGPQGLSSGGRHNSGFTYVADTNRMREACLVLGADEVAHSLTGANTAVRPILTSACPGWICYAEKTHPHVLPHLSKLKSPQALTGTLIKSVLSKSFGIHPSQIWHLAVMPCFDKKLEASREELTDRWWAHNRTLDESMPPVRDVDCVITSRELLTLAHDRGTKFESLPQTRLPKDCRVPFPKSAVSRFLLPKPRRRNTLHRGPAQSTAAGTSGGYLHYILAAQQSLHPGSTIHTQRGRNADVVEYTLLSTSQEPLLKCARFYGFRNIQNLVRKLKPARASRLPGAAVTRRGKDGVGGGGSGSEYAYVEVMACPGGCTNGGGQIRLDEAIALQRVLKQTNVVEKEPGEDQPQDSGNAISSQRDWLRRVDSAYFSESSSSSDDDDDDDKGDAETHDSDPERSGSNSASTSDPAITTTTATAAASSHAQNQIHDLLAHWSEYTSTPLEKLVYTSFRHVESDVGKNTGKKQKGVGLGDTERIAALAGSIGGGW